MGVFSGGGGRGGEGEEVGREREEGGEGEEVGREREEGGEGEEMGREGGERGEGERQSFPLLQSISVEGNREKD